MDRSFEKRALDCFDVCVLDGWFVSCGIDIGLHAFNPPKRSLTLPLLVGILIFDLPTIKGLSMALYEISFAGL